MASAEARLEPVSPLVRWFEDIGARDVLLVGGKAASLGEMFGALTGKGVRIPNGFATTVAAYDQFLEAPVFVEKWAALSEEARRLNPDVLRASTLREALRRLFTDVDPKDQIDLHTRSSLARALVRSTPVPREVDRSLRLSYKRLSNLYVGDVDLAVRSSATCEDSEMASFAGQYESFLNVRGEDGVVDAWRKCCASAFTERAIGYQLQHGMDPLECRLGVVVMKMVRSDIATSGVLFTLDPDSGNRNVIHITSAYGLGELVVQGSVSPDTFVIWKDGVRRGRPSIVHQQLGAKDQKLVYSSQGGTTTESVDVRASRQRQWSLTSGEALELARMALTIEEHYRRPVDIEWAKDGYSGELYIVQARPETVHANQKAGATFQRFRMDPTVLRELEAAGKIIVRGHAVGSRIGAGRVRTYRDYEEVILRKRQLRNRLAAGEKIEDIEVEDRVFDKGDVLVTELTTPDWEPLMKDASLIITEKGGRTSHAAIVAREFGIPAIVGVADATKILEPLMTVTGSCAEGDDGLVFEGIQPFEVIVVAADDIPETRTGVKLNVGFPGKALQDAMLPSDGVGLARLEFILTAQVGIHPLALAFFDELRDFAADGTLSPHLEPYKEKLEGEDPHELLTLLGAIERRTPGYADRRQFFVDQVARGVGLICAAFYPRPVLVRLSDLKSNEYRELLGGRIFEPQEENPMIAWRGASRYVDSRFAPAFEMECDALRMVRQTLGLDNLQLMVPFCRTPEEGERVVGLLDEHGLSPQAGVPLFLMVELPSNVIEADRFIEKMQLSGGSIGSNDLVQTVYAVSRDDLERYETRVDARSPAVKAMIAHAVSAFKARDLEIGICGQAPSDYPDEVPRFLVGCGISSISVTPDTVLEVRRSVAATEAEFQPSRVMAS
ncbi:MAG: phosphoenolpyruvate synthase [Gemmatimonadetes bacterium]|nr:phosphoenolpyruvate synthase [Gemmatimonadota bacterium]MDA1102915.1 phosphoenolpyruvate synthase [Gemmatimonadota bacterium]